MSHATGITVTYSYDSAGRLITYVENGTDYSHRIDYTYDEWGKLEEVTETINGTSHSTEYGYNDANRLISVTSGLSGKTYTYDDFGRVSERDVRHDGVMVFSEIISYRTANGKTSTQVEQLENGAGIFTYTYDGNGNIKTVTFEDLITGEETTTTYTYDKLNQLTREDNQAGNFTYVWEYDDGGNILSRKKYAYTTGNLGTPTETVNYGYGNANWGDLLTSYKGSNISYDTIGNVLSDGTCTYTWEHGRELATLTKDSKTWSFTYDANGMRTKRAYGSTVYRYVYNGSQLSQMTIGNNTLLFTYDAGGMPMTVTYNGTVYYYATNLQGDVVALMDGSGDVVVRYTYDAWGNILSIGGDLANTLGEDNPFRYRGYVYDTETGLYYLQSRYYNPAQGRFINADGFLSTGQGLLGNNIFAYCGNNPVNRVDQSGRSWIAVFLVIVACGGLLSGCSNEPDYSGPPYKSADAAAKAFSEEVYSSSSYIRHEYGTEIYSMVVDGETVYNYTPPRVGQPHSVIINNTVPAGATLVAYAHTHPNENSFSPQDLLVANKLGVDAYVVGPNLYLQRFTYSSMKTKKVVKISPNRLTVAEKDSLRNDFRVSWDAHIAEGCDFGCGHKTWPTP